MRKYLKTGILNTHGYSNRLNGKIRRNGESSAALIACIQKFEKRKRGVRMWRVVSGIQLQRPDICLCFDRSGEVQVSTEMKEEHQCLYDVAAKINIHKFG